MLLTLRRNHTLAGNDLKFFEGQCRASLACCTVEVAEAGDAVTDTVTRHSEMEGHGDQCSVDKITELVVDKTCKVKNKNLSVIRSSPSDTKSLIDRETWRQTCISLQSASC